MPTYYVGSGGNDGNAGTSWAQRKLTLNGAEDIPVAASDTVYVGPGTYRELLTCDVSGTSGNLISYIGDYTGANTDGVGGIVRITGSDNDTTAARANCITATSKNYRSFSGFTFDGTSASLINGATEVTNWTITKCAFYQVQSNAGASIYLAAATVNSISVSQCFFMGGVRQTTSWIRLGDGTPRAGSTGNELYNNICLFAHDGILAWIGNITIKNNVLMGCKSAAISVNTTDSEVCTANNNLLAFNEYGMYGQTLGELVENYNNFYANTTDRLNVAVGANSTAYPPLFDTRWFFEMVNGGSMVTPWDLASYSALVNVAGSSPPAADMRGTTIIGAAREWGPLEYDPNLDIEAGSGSGGGGPIVGSRIVRAV